MEPILMESTWDQTKTLSLLETITDLSRFSDPQQERDAIQFHLEDMLSMLLELSLLEMILYLSEDKIRQYSTGLND
jgi:hypothetical protein